MENNWNILVVSEIMKSNFKAAESVWNTGVIPDSTGPNRSNSATLLCLPILQKKSLDYLPSPGNNQRFMELKGYQI